MKTGYWILLIYVIIALIIMYKRSQSVACRTKGMPPLGGPATPSTCDTWNDIILPGLTLGLYNPAPAVVPPATMPLTDIQKCGPTPPIPTGGSAACVLTNGIWAWAVTGGSGGGNGGGTGNGGGGTPSAERGSGSSYNCDTQYTTVVNGTLQTWLCRGKKDFFGKCQAPFTTSNCIRIK